MRKYILLVILFNICSYSQDKNEKTGRVLDLDKNPIKNVYIIDSQKCQVVDKSNSNGYFKHSENISDLRFVKLGMEKINLIDTINLSNIYLKRTKPKKITNYIGLYPTRNTQVNGIAINFIADFDDDTITSTLTNGIEIDIDMLSALGVFYNILSLFEDESFTEPNSCLIDYKYIKKINGLNLNLVNFKPMVTNGLYFGVTSIRNITNGISFSVLRNRNSKINGISLSLLGNHDVSCNGIQIGLINTTSNLKGIQIGLWNKNEKRQFPFINWNFN